MEHNWVIAGLLDPGYDFVVIRDPQPAAVRSFVGGDGARWVWRCHIDTSHPNTRGLEFIMPLGSPDHTSVFTMDEFVSPLLAPAPIRGDPARHRSP